MRSTRSHSRTRVLVTGVTGGGVGFGILEALMQADYEVYATDITPYSAGLYKARKGFVIPPSNTPAYLRTVCTICRENDIRILVPGSEPELFELSRNSTALKTQGILLIANDHTLIANCRDKWEMFRMFREKAIPCPDSALPEKYEEFRRKHGFPMLMKQRTGSGSRNLFVVNDDDDYAFYSRKLEAEGIPFLLQEYVGSGSEEYTVGVVCRKDGSVIGSITVHRLLEGLSIQQSGTAKGKLVEISTGISQGVVEDNEKIQEQCQAYSVKLGVTGPANFQGRVVDGVFLVFELNPRFSGTTPFRAGVGFNDVDLVIRDRLWHNRPLRKPVFKTGVVVLRSLENVFVPLREMQKVAKMSISDS